MKRTPLKRGKLKSRYKSHDPKKQEEHQKRLEEKEKMIEFFASIWISIPFSQRECESCGKHLTDPIRSYYFDHLIEKSKRPDLALERDNIFLCCLTCHSLKTDGHPTEAHQKAIEKAKERFGIN